MSTPRPGTAGSTRTCPHCKTRILESASVCPACKHYLRIDSAASPLAESLPSPLKVEGIIRQPAHGGSSEYSVVVTIRNERGEEVSRHVVGVGALHPNEQRTFTLAVEMFAATGAKARRH
ncbi:hypothetical protein IP90_01450 [Luteimonas cucumeris]|uniref:Zinc ribbon domain-containing protein n=1 Tax=Luteimonas cucumeris TaxID=985012 RepID=A0A562L7Y4_9GAMM|nr:hypothetical protein [Luteimonas cucumeris]TWI03636.1 hypothetical protein IP90_01450 [Luteimonas cucumeris]